MSNLQNSTIIETKTTISKGCQPLPRVKDKDKDSDSSTINISLFECLIRSITLLLNYDRLIQILCLF
jgi:hypothetical protein